MEIVQAGVEHLEALVPLLDGYRVFYGQASDPDRAREFLRQRFAKGDSVIFMAGEAGEAAGFTQLFPSFSTVSLQRLFILNDLYVLPLRRHQGLGEALLRKAQEYCRLKACKGLALETAVENPARNLYERMGWEKESHCFHYFWTCSQPSPP